MVAKLVRGSRSSWVEQERWTRSSSGSAWRLRPEPRPFRRRTTTPNTTASESRLFPPTSSLSAHTCARKLAAYCEVLFRWMRDHAYVGVGVGVGVRVGVRVSCRCTESQP